MQMRLMCQFYNRLDIDILPPYIPSSVEARNPAFYARNVREVFSTHMGLPQVDQVLSSSVLFSQAVHLPFLLLYPLQAQIR